MPGAYSWPPSAEAVDLEWATVVPWNAREIHRKSSICVAVASRLHKHDEAGLCPLVTLVTIVKEIRSANERQKPTPL